MVQELDRLFPQQAPILDFDALPAGTESIESVSQSLWHRLLARQEQPVFFVFCRLNSERVLDHICNRLDVEAWPFDADEVLADAYTMLYQAILRRSMQQGKGALILDLLLDCADRILDDRIAELRAMQLPLPGMPLPVADIGANLQDSCRAILDQDSVQLSDEELRRWILYAWVQMGAPERRALRDRDSLGLDYDQIAAHQEITPLEASRLVRAAHESIADRIRWLIGVFVHNESPAVGEHPGPLPRPTTDHDDDAEEVDPEW